MTKINHLEALVYRHPLATPVQFCTNWHPSTLPGLKYPERLTGQSLNGG